MSKAAEAVAHGSHEVKGNAGGYVLGIDIGTTTVKCCVIEVPSKKVVQTLSRESKATLISEHSNLGNEQDVHKICLALQFAVSRITRDIQTRIRRITISGQMHGVVLWKRGESWHQNSFSRFEIGERARCLYTWQDGRCTTDFLSQLPPPSSHLRLSSGHGCATIFWLQKHTPEYLSYYDCAGTIQDFVVAMLCGLDEPRMSPQNAASWGYYDTVDNSWNIQKLSAEDFPVHLLPPVVDNGSVAGALKSAWYAIPEGTAVEVALGDMQCSVNAAIQSDNDAVLNISTSAQMSFMMPQGFIPSHNSPPSTIEYFPYFRGRYLAVAASLNGGNAMAAFVKMLQQWTHELGLGVPEEKIWEKMLTVASEEQSADSDLCVVVPTLFGERHSPHQRATVSNIDSVNISLGKVVRGLCRGIIKNLVDMMPRDRLIEAGVNRIVGTGSALIRNSVLKQELEVQYGLPVVYQGDKCDAAHGAALHAASQLIS